MFIALLGDDLEEKKLCSLYCEILLQKKTNIFYFEFWICTIAL